MGYKLGDRSRKRLEGVHPSLIKLIEYSLIDSPYDFGIPQDGGLRTAIRQAELYSKGRGGGGKIITYVDGFRKKSNHQEKSDGYGHAFDIYALINGKASWDKRKLKSIATHIKKCAKELDMEIEWGGDWKSFQDMPHFQLRK